MSSALVRTAATPVIARAVAALVIARAVDDEGTA